MNNRFFPAMQEVAERISRAPHVLLALDYDGTLTPIVDDPGRALLSVPMRELIEAMTGRHDVDVALVSGRALSDLQQLTGGHSKLVAPNRHGLGRR